MAAKRGPYATGTARRIKILEATERLVREHGHEAITMRMVAAEVGVTDPALYHHFPTKERLFVELLRFRDERVPRPAPGRDAVETLLDTVRRNQSDPNGVRLFAAMASAAADPAHPARDYFTQRYHAVNQMLAQAIAGTDEPTERDRVAAVLLVATADGLMTQWLVNSDLDMAHHLRVAVEGILPLTSKF